MYVNASKSFQGPSASCSHHATPLTAPRKVAIGGSAVAFLVVQSRDQILRVESIRCSLSQMVNNAGNKLPCVPGNSTPCA